MAAGPALSLMTPCPRVFHRGKQRAEIVPFMAGDALELPVGTFRGQRRVIMSSSKESDSDYRPDEVIGIRCLEGADLQLAPASSVNPRPVDWLWQDRIPLGMLTCLSGKQGLGKSTLGVDLAARVSRGWAMPEESSQPSRGPRDVIFLSSEDSPESIILPRLKAAGADLSRVQLVPSGSTGSWTVRDGVASLEQSIIKHRAALVYIDPLNSYLTGSANTNSDARVRQVMNGLNQVASKTGAAIVYVVHVRKSAGSALDGVLGSVALSALPRSVLMLGKSRADDQHLVLAQAKNNVGSWSSSLRLRIVDGGGAGKVHWEGISHETADEICAPEPIRNKGSAKGEAEDFLRTFLAQRPVPTTLLQREAKNAGISWASIRRAAEEIGVEKRKDGYQGQWTWALPQGAQPADATSEMSTFADGDASSPSGGLDVQGSSEDAQDAHIYSMVSTLEHPPVHLRKGSSPGEPGQETSYCEACGAVVCVCDVGVAPEPAMDLASGCPSQG